jgi:hypothetical protein
MALELDGCTLETGVWDGKDAVVFATPVPGNRGYEVAVGSSKPFNLFASENDLQRHKGWLVAGR